MFMKAENRFGFFLKKTSKIFIQAIFLKLEGAREEGKSILVNQMRSPGTKPKIVTTG